MALNAKSAKADLVPADSDISNFHQDNASVFRGARPTTAVIQWLAQNHIKTDIDLEDDMDAVNQEESDTQQFGLIFNSIPLNTYLPPSEQDVAQILNIMASPQSQPVFVHCHFGDDRTGLIMALYRVKYDGWTPKAAYEEMIADGITYTGRLVFMPYFEKSTGFSPTN